MQNAKLPYGTELSEKISKNRCKPGVESFFEETSTKQKNYSFTKIGKTKFLLRSYKFLLINEYMSIY